MESVIRHNMVMQFCGSLTVNNTILSDYTGLTGLNQVLLLLINTCIYEAAVAFH